jgi:hypothetical protein
VAGLNAAHRLEVRCDPSPLPDAGSALLHGIGVSDPSRLVVACDGVWPAATLTDGALPAAARVPRRAAEDAPAKITTAQPGHALVGLLLAALAALGGFGFVLLRRGVGPFAPAPAAEPAIDTESGRGVGTAEDATGRSLTLLPLPRERGSP